MHCPQSCAIQILRNNVLENIMYTSRLYGLSALSNERDDSITVSRNIPSMSFVSSKGEICHLKRVKFSPKLNNTSFYTCVDEGDCTFFDQCRENLRLTTKTKTNQIVISEKPLAITSPPYITSTREGKR